jgi:hypothetical protein
VTIHIRLTNGEPLLDILDGRSDTTETSLTLLGVGAVGYAQALAQNSVFMLENFSNPTPPRDPLVGQLWYDSNEKTFKVFNGGDWDPAESTGKPASAPPIVYLRSPSHVWALSVDDNGVLSTAKVS